MVPANDGSIIGEYPEDVVEAVQVVVVADENDRRFVPSFILVHPLMTSLRLNLPRVSHQARVEVVEPIANGFTPAGA